MRSTALLLCLTIFFFGCTRRGHLQTPVDGATGLSALVGGDQLRSAPMAMALYVGNPANASQSQRFVAIRHKLEVVSKENDLAGDWEAVIKFCGTIRCEVISSSIVARTTDSAPSGAIALRVFPEDFDKLFNQIEKRGNVVEHTTQSEDKTSQVLDVEAQIKNQSAYRDSLRAMLAKPLASVKDLIEIQEKLTEVQSQLDSETANRKVLANETEKIAVEVNFRVDSPGRHRSAFAPIWDAFSESGANLAESIAILISFVIAVIPWLLALAIIVWLIKHWWRRRGNATRRNFA